MASASHATACWRRFGSTAPRSCGMPTRRGRSGYVTWRGALDLVGEPGSLMGRTRGHTHARHLDLLDGEHDNLREALRWSLIEAAPESARWAGQRLVAALWPFWWMRSHFGDGARWLEPAVAIPEYDDDVGTVHPRERADRGRRAGDMAAGAQTRGGVDSARAGAAPSRRRPGAVRARADDAGPCSRGARRHRRRDGALRGESDDGAQGRPRLGDRLAARPSRTGGDAARRVRAGDRAARREPAPL